jgi:putative redox protein
MSQADKTLDEAVAHETGQGRYQAEISTGGITFLADEPVEAGGLGTGPSPYQLLASALAACTTMTLRLYATRKGWAVDDIRTAVGHRREPGAVPPDIFVREIRIEGELDQDQRNRLLEIADRCPVHRTLIAGSQVRTSMGDTIPAAASAQLHMADMEALIAVGRGSFDFTQ